MDSLYSVLHRGPEASASGAPLLVLLHGYGSNEEDLLGLAPYLDPRLVCISARAPHVLPFGGYAWFEIEWSEEGIRFDYEQAWDAVQRIADFVAELRHQHQPEQIALAGFSQGAIMALTLALRQPSEFVGAAALSGTCGEEMLPTEPESVRGLPIFMAHGRQDEIIPIEQARAARDLLQALPVDLSYLEYDMGHAIDAECLADWRQWLSGRLTSA